jgi:hypothetical protein
VMAERTMHVLGAAVTARRRGPDDGDDNGSGGVEKVVVWSRQWRRSWMA